MQKLNEKKILGTVPKKLQLVETFWDCPEFSKGKNKGITLIALIITIIVMLILVGVTINVALNGGLFKKGEKAAFQTEVSTVKEQIELAKALKVMNAKGKPVNDYSDIVVGNLEGLDEKTKTKYANIIVVNKNGDICYNPEKVTAEEKVWLEELGIKALAGGGTPTIAYGQKYIMVGESDSYIIFLEDGTTDGTARPDSVTKITYEVKTEEGKNVVYASLDDAEAIPYGIFNEDFTEFKTTVGEEVIFRLEGVIPNLYNVAYEKEGVMELTLYKNGMFTIEYPSYIVGMAWTGSYAIEGSRLTLDGMNDGFDALQFTISEDFYTFTGIADNENFSGDWVRDDSNIDNYNPTFDTEKGIYKSALYISESGTNAISISQKYIHLEQDQIENTEYVIKLENFDKATNTKISVNGDGTVITYNGEDYTLITKAQMNGEA